MVFLCCISCDFAFNKITDYDICSALEVIAQNDSRFICNLEEKKLISDIIPVKINGKQTTHHLKNLTCFENCSSTIVQSIEGSKKSSEIDLLAEISINDLWSKDDNTFAVLISQTGTKQYSKLTEPYQLTIVYLIEKKGQSYNYLSREVLN